MVPAILIGTFISVHIIPRISEFSELLVLPGNGAVREAIEAGAGATIADFGH
jgi:microcompartment protein CcmL/EutN